MLSPAGRAQPSEPVPDVLFPHRPLIRSVVGCRAGGRCLKRRLPQTIITLFNQASARAGDSVRKNRTPQAL